MTPKQEAHKKVRRVLMDPDCRAALKDLGIEIEVVDKPETQAEKPTVVILMPSYKAPEAETSNALSRMIRYTNESGKAYAYTGDMSQMGVVHWARNYAMTEHLKSGHPWTHVLMIDDDMVPEPDALLKLLEAQKDIISGICTRRFMPANPAIRVYDEPTQEYKLILDWPEDRVFDTGGAAGAAFILATRHAMEQVATAYFECMWEKDFYGVSEEWIAENRKKRLEWFDKTANCFWFRFLPSPSQPIELGEDTSFCHMARKYCGIPIYCDPRVIVGHIGKWAYTVNDYRQFKPAMIEQAKKEGVIYQPPQMEQVGPSFHVTFEEPVNA